MAFEVSCIPYQTDEAQISTIKLPRLEKDKEDNAGTVLIQKGVIDHVFTVTDHARIHRVKINGTLPFLKEMNSKSRITIHNSECLHKTMTKAF